MRHLVAQTQPQGPRLLLPLTHSIWQAGSQHAYLTWVPLFTTDSSKAFVSLLSAQLPLVPDITTPAFHLRPTREFILFLCVVWCWSRVHWIPLICFSLCVTLLAASVWITSAPAKPKHGLVCFADHRLSLQRDETDQSSRRDKTRRPRVQTFVWTLSSRPPNSVSITNSSSSSFEDADLSGLCHRIDNCACPQFHFLQHLLDNNIDLEETRRGRPPCPQLNHVDQPALHSRNTVFSVGLAPQPIPGP